jgi:hypothetical protein
MTADDGLRQSLEMLGELIVRKAVQYSGSSESPRDEKHGRSRMSSKKPSQLLAGLAMAPPQYGEVVAGLLAKRLASLGLDEPESAFGKPVRLLQEATLKARLEPVKPDAKIEDPGELDTATTSESRVGLRRLLNEQVRDFYRISYLTEYRTKPVRRAPRLTVFIVGDMGEPFVRSEYRTLLREIHAELLRAFTPIFESFREGFDQALSVVPVIWMPHPADPYEGKELAQRHCEEAVIIDAIHSVRRWVESVMPPSRRRVSQIFVNSRVTDTAVLDSHDAARQTRDFITLLSRNDISRDEWLRRTATGPRGEDYFASFSCYEIDFPAEKAREYLANRLARDLLSRLRKPRHRITLEPVQQTLDKPGKGKLIEGAVGEVDQLTGKAAGKLEHLVQDRLTVDRRTTGRRITETFSESFEQHLLTQISDEWGRITQHRGRMDELVDKLRVETSELLTKAIRQVREDDDRLIEELSHYHGIRGVLAELNEQAGRQRDEVEHNEVNRRACEQLCVQHSIPRTDSVGRLRREVVAAAERKPDLLPIRIGLVLIGLLAPVLGAPLCQAVAYYYELHQDPGVLELLLGPLAPLTGGLVLLLTAWLLLSRHLKRSLERVQEAIRHMARGVREVIDGGGSEPLLSGRSSLRSFFAARLELTATLAMHSFALRVLERREGDRNLARRLSRSLDIQSHQLRQKAEDLGMRPQMMGSAGELDADDVSADDVRDLFAVRSGESPDRLVSPESLITYYHRELVRDEDYQALLPEFVHKGGGFADWRKTACLSDGEPLLGFCRKFFQKLVNEPIQEQGAFADEVGQRLLCFVSRRYPNIGFGAKFIGSEGLDPDGVKVFADAALLLHPDLQGLFRQARNQEGAPPITRTMDIHSCQVRPNSAYMLSLVQGIRAHSVRNLKRFESFHDRPQLPDDRTFPLSSDEDQLEHGTINHFTSEHDVVDHLNRLPEPRDDDEQKPTATDKAEQP